PDYPRNRRRANLGGHQAAEGNLFPAMDHGKGGSTVMAETRKLRVGMVGGGGPGNFFGGPHRRGILLDNSAELTAGALRSSAQGSLGSATELYIPRADP